MQFEDRRADVADCLVEVVDGVLEPGRHLLLLSDADRALQAQPGGEEPLDHRVVEVAGDALPVLDEGQLGDAGVEPGVLDGDAGRRRPGRRPAPRRRR